MATQQNKYESIIISLNYAAELSNSRVGVGLGAVVVDVLLEAGMALEAVVVDLVLEAMVVVDVVLGAMIVVDVVLGAMIVVDVVLKAVVVDMILGAMVLGIIGRAVVVGILTLGHTPMVSCITNTLVNIRNKLAVPHAYIDEWTITCNTISCLTHSSKCGEIPCITRMSRVLAIT